MTDEQLDKLCKEIRGLSWSVAVGTVMVVAAMGVWQICLGYYWISRLPGWGR